MLYQLMTPPGQETSDICVKLQDIAKSSSVKKSVIKWLSNIKTNIYLVIYLVWPHQYELVQPMG